MDVLNQSYPLDSIETPQSLHDTNLNLLESLPCKALFSDDHSETIQLLDLTQHCEQKTPDFESSDPSDIIKESDHNGPHDQNFHDSSLSLAPSSLMHILQAESEVNMDNSHELCKLNGKEDIIHPIVESI